MTRSIDPGSRIRLAHYLASDGPRIMMFGPHDADFAAVRDLFLHLSTSPGMICSLETQPFVAAFGGIQVSMICHDRPLGPHRCTDERLQVVKGGPPLAFKWARTAGGWDHLAALTDSLIHSSSTGHQYLTDNPTDDAIVILSKGEYGDEALSR